MTWQFSKRSSIQTERVHHVMARRTDNGDHPVLIATAVSEDWADHIAAALNQTEGAPA